MANMDMSLMELEHTEEETRSISDSGFDSSSDSVVEYTDAADGAGRWLLWRADCRGIRRCAENVPRMRTQEIAISESSGNEDGFEEEGFHWNGKDCTGNRLHVAIAENNLFEVRKIVEEDPAALEASYTYDTVNEDGLQCKGTGLPIHLAVTRGSVAMVDYLLEKKASLDSMTTRDGYEYYDVLHAAVWGEGKGSTKEMIGLLLYNGAKHSTNRDGHYPLHKVFFTKRSECAEDVIKLLTEDMSKRNPDVFLSVETDYNAADMSLALEQGLVSVGGIVRKKLTPLMFGIVRRNLTPKQLANIASVTETSLRIFFKYCPSCLPRFMERMKEKYNVAEVTKLLVNVPIHDFCLYIRDFPDMSNFLLEYLLVVPEVDHEGHHPLPKQMSFGPRGWMERARNLVNPPRETITRYMHANEWKYDSTHMDYAEWHKDLENLNYGEPVMDVEIKVFRYPNILNCRFLGALVHSKHLKLFENQVVSSAVEAVWSTGPVKVDVLQLAFTVLGIVFLVLDQWNIDILAHRHRTSDDFIVGDFEMGKHTSVSDCFISARGFLDLFNEVVQLMGHATTEHWRSKKHESSSTKAWLLTLRRSCGDYFSSISNWFDLARAFLAISFFAIKEGHPMRVTMIILCWMRLLEVYTSECVLYESLPIIQSAKSLVPSLAVCLVGVCAVTHAEWSLNSDRFWPYAFFDSFNLLLKGDMPDVHGEDRPRNTDLFFKFVVVAFFTVFILNVFIAVISENWESEKQQVQLTLKKKKCELCSLFLARASILRISIDRNLGIALHAIIAFLLLLILITASVFVEWAPRPKTLVAVLFMLMLLALLICYQDNEEMWDRDPKDPLSGEEEQYNRYFWICSPTSDKPLREQLSEDIERLKKEKYELMGQVGLLKELKNSKASFDDGATRTSSPSGASPFSRNMTGRFGSMSSVESLRNLPPTARPSDI